MIKVYNWGRYMGDGLRFNRPSSYMAYGVRGSGKSSLLEAIAEEYLKMIVMFWICLGLGMVSLWHGYDPLG